MMIAPCLPNGLDIKLKGKIGSRPYINMTRAVMKQFGVEAIWQDDQQLTIPHSAYHGISYRVEPDWSSASYWYSIVALDGRLTVLLKGLTVNSIQGDRIIADMMQSLGVHTEFTAEGALLKAAQSVQHAEFDFTDCPDLAQTVAVICAAKGITCLMSGLESLRIKETDRIAALQNELRKIGSDLVESNDNWILRPGNLVPPKAPFQTYHDHRMAMAFAPLAWLFPVSVQDPSVVSKSYPDFWDDLTEAGAEIAPTID
jgi:3-phosphoshikimate 1-carboxyvinyltransferase